MPFQWPAWWTAQPNNYARKDTHPDGDNVAADPGLDPLTGAYKAAEAKWRQENRAYEVALSEVTAHYRAMNTQERIMAEIRLTIEQVKAVREALAEARREQTPAAV